MLLGWSWMLLYASLWLTGGCISLSSKHFYVYSTSTDGQNASSIQALQPGFSFRGGFYPQEHQEVIIIWKRQEEAWWTRRRLGLLFFRRSPVVRLRLRQLGKPSLPIVNEVWVDADSCRAETIGMKYRFKVVESLQYLLQIGDPFLLEVFFEGPSKQTTFVQSQPLIYIERDYSLERFWLFDSRSLQLRVGFLRPLEVAVEGGYFSLLKYIIQNQSTELDLQQIQALLRLALRHERLSFVSYLLDLYRKQTSDPRCPAFVASTPLQSSLSTTPSSDWSRAQQESTLPSRFKYKSIRLSDLDLLVDTVVGLGFQRLAIDWLYPAIFKRLLIEQKIHYPFALQSAVRWFQLCSNPYSDSDDLLDAAASWIASHNAADIILWGQLMLVLLDRVPIAYELFRRYTVHFSSLQHKRRLLVHAAMLDSQSLDVMLFNLISSDVPRQESQVDLFLNDEDKMLVQTAFLGACRGPNWLPLVQKLWSMLQFDPELGKQCICHATLKNRMEVLHLILGVQQDGDPNALAIARDLHRSIDMIRLLKQSIN